MERFGKRKQIEFILVGLKSDRIWKCKVLKKIGNMDHVAQKRNRQFIIESTYYYIPCWNHIAIHHFDREMDRNDFFLLHVASFTSFGRNQYKTNDEYSSPFDDKIAKQFRDRHLVKQAVKPQLNKNLSNIIVNYVFADPKF